MATLTAEQIAGYAAAAGFPADQVATATAVALAESGGNTDASHRNSNGSTDYGLFQINSVHGSLLDQGNRFDPAANARMAYNVWKGAGGSWSPWATYTSQRYRAFVPRATLAAARPSSSPAGASATGEATAGDAAAAVVQGAAQATTGSGILDLLYQLLSGSFWLRIGAFLLGGILMFISLWQLTGAGDRVIKLAGTAAKAAVAA